MTPSEFQKRTEQIELLVRRVSALPDENARASALELLQALMDLHGAGIAKVVELLQGSDEAGAEVLAKMGRDPLLCGLLVLYDQHPVPLEERVAAALDRLRPQLHKQEGNAELVGVREGVVSISLTSAKSGSSEASLRRTVEQAILEGAPEVTEIVMNGVPASAEGFVPVNMIQPASKEETHYEESTA
jgi:Fe-S cluster biogenesis protein NfuA